MNFIVETKKPLNEKELNNYGIKIVFNKGRRYALLAEDLKGFIEFLLKTDYVEKILYKESYTCKADFLQKFLDNLIELQGELSIKYQKIFSPEGKVIGAEFFCGFPIHPVVLQEALKETCFADYNCVRSVAEAVVKKGWEKLVFINLFPKSLEKSDFMATLTAEIVNKGLQNQFVLEVLEQEIEEESVKRNLKFARMHGLKIAIDDWGSENAGVARVVNLKPDFVKIDKSITWNKEAREVVEGLIPKLQQKGIKVIVEGVENEEHFNWAKKLNAYMQGFYLHKPEPF